MEAIIVTMSALFLSSFVMGLTGFGFSNFCITEHYSESQHERVFRAYLSQTSSVGDGEASGVMLKDGLAQARDGVFLGINVYYESEFFCCVRRYRPDAGDGDSFNKGFKSVLR